MRKKNVRKLRLHRESLCQLDLRTATGGATRVDCTLVITTCNTKGPSCPVDCSFIFTGCVGHPCQTK